MKAVFVGGRYNGVEIDVDEIFTTDGMWSGGFRPNYSDTRYKGGLVPRAELDNQPLVDGYLPPMWDDGKLRYETSEVYDLLSR